MGGFRRLVLSCHHYMVRTMVQTQEIRELTIAGLARAGGVGVETVRYYQRRGLLDTPERRGSEGHGSPVRRYGEADMRKLRFVRSAQAAGFTLEQIAELIALDATDGRTRARELAARRVEALDTKIAELTAARTALSRLARECGDGSAGPCPILTAFADP
jgi:MerR family transcriptional regulator, mercuric resistance operon regulatory protein